MSYFYYRRTTTKLLFPFQSKKKKKWSKWILLNLDYQSKTIRVDNVNEINWQSNWEMSINYVTNENILDIRQNNNELET